MVGDCPRFLAAREAQLGADVSAHLRRASLGRARLPAGWGAQWDATRQEFYYFPLDRSGPSQWEVPTAPIGAVPAGV